VAFRVVGIPLKGVDSAVTNAQVMHAVNSAGRLMLTGDVGVAAVFQGSGTEYKRRVEVLLYDTTRDVGEDAESKEEGPAVLACRIWEAMLGAAKGVLTAAFQHVGGCNCDMGDALRALADARENEQRLQAEQS